MRRGGVPGDGVSIVSVVWVAHEEGGTWWAASDDLPGVSVADDTWDGLCRRIAAVMHDLLDAYAWHVVLGPTR